MEPALKNIDDVQSSPKLRVIELILVTGVAFAGSIFSAVYDLFARAPAQSPEALRVYVFYGLIYEASAIGVLAYVLFRQGRSLGQLGLTFRWADIPVSLLLAIASTVAYYVCYAVLIRGHRPAVGQAADSAARAQTYLDVGLAIGPILFVLLNPFYEELIARAYVMSEVKDLTGNGALAISISVGLQILYHLYQGVVGAISVGAGFLIFSLYYARSRRITPIILAHMFLDALALWGSSRH